MKTERMRYVGPIENLKGKTALIVDGPEMYGDDPGIVRAQFDERNLMHKGAHMASGWHPAKRTDFEDMRNLPEPFPM